SRAGLRSHPGVRQGALRRRWREWERPHTVSWRPAEAGDAGWMFGKSRTRLAPVLTEAPSWMSDRSSLRRLACALRSIPPKRATLPTFRAPLLTSYTLVPWAREPSCPTKVSIDSPFPRAEAVSDVRGVHGMQEI